MRYSHKVIVVAETLLSWGVLLLAASFAFFAYAPSPEDFASPTIGYSMAATLVLAAVFLHFSAGHLERHGRLLVPLHLAPLILIGLAVALPGIAT